MPVRLGFPPFLRRLPMLAGLVGLVAGILPVHGQWKGPCGYTDLVEFLNGAPVPVPIPGGSGVIAGQVEAENVSGSYLPGIGSYTTGEYAGKTFTDVTGGASTTSTHAGTVGRNIYGNTISAAPDITDIRCWEALDFLFDELRLNGGRVQTFVPNFGNHSWIIPATGGNDGTTACRRLDEVINDSQVTMVVGTNNGNSTTIPEGFAPCYNTISVGRSDGNHAAGFTPAMRDGPGRVKPEIVVEETTTSDATGAASSMIAVLMSSAPAAAQRPEVLKAIVMAGATKEEFPSWDKTPARPLDERYGAGEMNVLHSYRIAEAGDQAPGAVSRRGWDLLEIAGSGSTTYSFTVPAAAKEAAFSLMATWNRTLSYFGSPFSGGYTPDSLPDVNLEFRDGSGTVIQESASAVDNVEHIWFPSLAPGTYTLTVIADQAVDIGLAWRTELKHMPRIVPPVDPGATIGLDGMITGVDYRIERTTGLVVWTLEDTVTATGSTMDWTDPSPPATDDVFYRIGFVAP